MNTISNDSKNPWKWAFIYYDKNDKRVWVPKRNPHAGFTLNFAQPQAYVMLSLVLLAPILVILLVWLNR